MIIMKLTSNQPSALRKGMKTDPFQKEITKKMRSEQSSIDCSVKSQTKQYRRGDTRTAGYKGYTPVYEQQASFPDRELANCIVCSNGKAQAAVPSMFAMSSEHPWKIQCTACDRVGIYVQKLNSALTSNDLK
jgi:hypothetical protein